MLKKLKCLEAKARLAREMANAQVNSNNNNNPSSVATNSDTLSSAPSPNHCSSTTEASEGSSMSAGLRVVKTEPMDYEMLHLEQNYNERTRLGDHEGQFATKTSSSCSSLSGSQQSSNSSPNTNTNPPQQRYQHVQIQTVPPRQGLSSSSNSSNSSNNQTAAHKVILTPRLEYLQMVQAGSGGGVAGLSDRSSAVTTSTVTPQIIITRTLPSSHNNSTVTSSSTAHASPNHHQQPHHIPRRHSASPSYHQRLTVTGRIHNSNSAPSSPPPLHQSSSVVNPAAHVTQHVRVIQNGRYYENTLGATVANAVRRQTASPPPLQHYSRSVPLSVSPAIGADGHARRYMSQTQAPLPPPVPPPPPSPIVSTAINAAIAANGGGSELASLPTCSSLAVSGTSAGQQYLLTHTPTRKYVLTPSGSRQINVISANHSSSISSTSASASSQQMQHTYATTQHSTATSPSTSSLQHSSHHSPQQQHHQYVASPSASASASASFSPSSPSKTTPSTASSNHIFRTPVVSSSSGHHLHHSNTSTHYQHQQHNHPNNHSYHQSNNNNNNTNANNNNNNNNNTVMRPPPPPPPPKIKHSTLGMNVNGALGIGGSGGLGGNNSNTTSNNNNPINHGNGLRSSPLASSTSAGAASSLPSCSSTAGLNRHCEEPSSSIPDLEFDGTTVLCRVCGDKASGFHYGVHSCEGCKGFFRRSIQQKIQYRPCTKNQQCSILRINRNRCQYCRLKKCIAVGMSRDAVRFGRVPKREKARIMAAMQQSTQNRGQQNAVVTELDDQPRLMATVLRAHLDTCEFTREKVAALRQQAFECPTYSMPTLLACPLNPAPEFSSEMEFSQRFAYVIRGIIDFASKIPGFQFLNQDDKFTLLKAGLFDALFVRLFYMFDSSINSIICLNGEVIRRDDIQNGTNARFLVDSTFKFAERMNSMNLSDAEIGLFCAIVLFTPDRPGLRNIELIDKMYTGLKGCLQTIINQNRPDQPEFMSTLLDTIPDLRTLSTLHTEKLVVFRTEHKDLLRQQICPDENRSPPPKSPPAWEDNRMDVEAKSPLGSVSSTDSGDMDYQAATSTAPTVGPSSSSDTNHCTIYQQPSSLASSAPLLAATLSGTNALRNRANSGSSGDSNGDLDLVGSHAHLTQNGLTITPIIRAHSHQHLHPHHLNAAPGAQHRYRKLDSPTDSGIESGNERNECKAVSSGGSSSCSSPRSSVDDALDCTDGAASATTTTTITTTTQANVSGSPIRSSQLTAAAATSTSGAANSGSNASTTTLKRQIVEDMPVLKRVLQAPPLYDTNSLMDEAYKPHKKFRALRHREYETTEADASTSTNINTMSGTPVPAGTPVHQRSSGQSQGCSTISSPSTPPTTTGHISVAPQVSVSSLAPTTSSSPSTQPHHQTQLHIHLTRPNANNSSSTLHQSPLAQPPLPQQQQQQHSSLSSTHSVLAKSLMAEPRMTPEQMKRSDIIQNYIMRESSNSSLRVCSPHATGSRSPTTQHMGLSNHCYAPGGNSSPASSSSPNLHCASPSVNQVTSMASPPPAGAGAAPGSQRWQGHSVITTTSVNQRQPSVSPNSNGSSSSTSSINSTTSSSNNSGCQYFQSPHSTSASVSPPRPSPSSNIHASPRLLELQVDIADSQQPLNLSKKSPTPPPSKLQALVAAATATQRYPQVSTDATITGTTTSNIPNDSSNTAGPNNSNSQQVQVHKLMLEA